MTINPLTPRNDWRLTSPYNIQYIAEKKGDENKQIEQPDYNLLILSRILLITVYYNA